MNSATTNELTLVRLWYLIGEWEGTGKGPDFRFRCNARCMWTLGDHFLVVQFDFSDASSGKALMSEHTLIYYDHNANCLVGDVFGSNSVVEHALGFADSRGRMALTTDRLTCFPKGFPVRRLRRTFWVMASSQWAFTVEQDLGEGFVPYLEGQMHRRGG
jgi:hypothetical protein